MDAVSETNRYRRMLRKYGEPVTIRVFSGTGPNRTSTDNPSCLGFIRGYRPEELVGTIKQGDQELVVLAADVTQGPKNKDMALYRGHAVTIEGVDDNTRNIQGTLIAYVLHCRGT